MNNISIVGVGRLGLCLALCYEKAGYNVLGVDIRQEYVDELNKKTFKTTEPYVNDMLLQSKQFQMTTDLSKAIEHSQLIYILVDTPNSGDDNHYDVSKVNSVLTALKKLKVKNRHIVIGCTVLPGYIAEMARPLMKSCSNVTISYNPEFIQQGDIIRGFLNPDMVLIGEDCKEVGDILVEIYKRTCQNSPYIARMSAESAELCKIALNCFITTKISYANMVGDIADQIENANKQDVLRAIGHDSRVGTKYLKPGYGYGGPCFPRDNRAFITAAKKVGIEPYIPRATDNYNNYHTNLQTEQLANLNKENYMFTDVAYKPNCTVPIIEESQKLQIAINLAKMGHKVTIKDRQFILDEVKKQYGDLFEYCSL